MLLVVIGPNYVKGHICNELGALLPIYVETLHARYINIQYGYANYTSPMQHRDLGGLRASVLPFWRYDAPYEHPTGYPEPQGGFPADGRLFTIGCMIQNFALPVGQGKFKNLTILDENTVGTLGYDYFRLPAAAL